MRSTRRRVLLFLCGLILPAGLHAQESRVHYTVSIPDPASETFAVTAELHGITPDTLRFLFPIWAPGMYDIIDFGGQVSDMTARGGDGSAVAFERIAPGSFRILDPPDELHLSYSVHDSPHWSRGAWFARADINPVDRFAFANGPALFGYCKGYTRVPHTVTYVPPPGWDLAVALEEGPGRDGARAFNAAGYDELVDAPVQMGTFQSWTFMVEGVPHTITFSGDEPISSGDGAAMVEEVKRVVEIISGFFGEVPSDRYLFQCYSYQSLGSFGALEHANSSTYLMRYGDTFVETAAHEYWHLWSPKRFHVSTLGPFDYRTPPATSSLWFHEGVTEYYSQILLARNGIIRPNELLRAFPWGLTDLIDTTDIVSMTQFSRELPWHGFGSSHRLYEEGAGIALLLDLEIRAQTGNQRSLDDAMRHFNTVYGDHRGGKAFDDDDIIPIIEEATGAELSDFYARYIDCSERPPVERLLGSIGLIAVIIPDVGFALRAVDSGWQVNSNFMEGILPASGLRYLDTIIAFIPQGEAPIPVGEILAPRVATSPKGSWRDTGRTSIVMSVPVMADGSVSPSVQITSHLIERFRVWGDRPVTIRFRRSGEIVEKRLVMRWRIDHLEIDPDASAEAEAVRREMFGF